MKKYEKLLVKEILVHKKLFLFMFYFGVFVPLISLIDTTKDINFILESILMNTCLIPAFVFIIMRQEEDKCFGIQSICVTTHTRKDIVISRFNFGMLFTILTILISFIVIFIASLFSSKIIFSSLFCPVCLGVYFLAICFSLSVMLLISFNFKYQFFVFISVFTIVLIRALMAFLTVTFKNVIFEVSLPAFIVLLSEVVTGMLIVLLFVSLTNKNIKNKNLV